MFTITAKGRERLAVVQSYCNPKPLTHFRLHKELGSDMGDFSGFVQFESMLELTERGWNFSERSGSKRLPSYKPGNEKLWFFNKTISRHYLQTLLLSDVLFQLGLKEIFHFQASAYYKTLLHLMKFPHRLNDVQAWQPLEFYKVLQQQAHRRPAQQIRAREGDMEVDDGGLSPAWYGSMGNACRVRVHPLAVLMLRYVWS